MPLPVRWVTAPGEPALAQVGTALRAGTGAALIGPVGVGKTTLAEHVVERVAPDFGRVDWVRATVTRAPVPFAAFAHLFAVPESGSTAAVLRAARERLGDARLLVVDDAHLLDPLSAALVYQLAVGRSVTPVLTVSTDSAHHTPTLPAEIAALWQDGLVARVDLHPAGQEDGRLRAQVDEFVAGLAPDVRRVLEFLAVCDPLPLEQAALLTSAHAVDAALGAHAVTLSEDGLRPAQPLFADAARDRLGGPELRRLRTAVVEHLPADGVVARLQRAVLALDSDWAPPAADVRSAAQEALRLGALELCERLGRAALQLEPNLSARLAVGYALAWQGRGREADEVLADIDPDRLSEPELLAWALPTAANRFWMLSAPEHATAFLHSTRAKLTTPAARTTLDALSATFAMNSGNLARATELATAVLASPDADETAVGWAASAAALTSARSGAFDAVDALAEQALAAGQPGLLRFTSGYGQTTALVMTGEPHRALALAQRLTEYAQRRQPGRAIGEVLQADALIALGEPAAAVTLLRESAATLAPTGYSWGPLAWMLLSQALGRLGQAVEAGKALTRAESRHGLKSMLFAPELAVARAWTNSARRDSFGAVAAARDAVKAAQRGGQTAVALRALRTAVELGDRRALDSLLRVCDEVDCAFGRDTVALARGRT
ncbi:ATPase AAA [Mycolicibacterium duvalii]|uniref:ATPase AAA n=1 Tax=Mycolicibacterium duvalii TaxID=39688 RepID=A0A7I7JU09_9MYCO|nr:ATPase AAA [Mycolicibacterium duvalii]